MANVNNKRKRPKVRLQSAEVAPNVIEKDEVLVPVTEPIVEEVVEAPVEEPAVELTLEDLMAEIPEEAPAEEPVVEEFTLEDIEIDLSEFEVDAEATQEISFDGLEELFKEEK